ncbi:uncharacterized protein LOC135924064 [Gordionus sp. m RMFG-2023]|uniref:uncharacterized protein LOC135924064 n=1 Tax=Gordionus sp. m RMFG-2023 TaxID=3053472 RepID=UPI0031FDEC94
MIPSSYRKSRYYKNKIYLTCISPTCPGKGYTVNNLFTETAACNDICKYLSGDSQSLAVYSQGQTVNLPVQDYSQSLAGYSQGQFVNLPVQDDSQILAGYSQRQSMNLPVHADNAQLMDSSTQTNISKLGNETVHTIIFNISYKFF